MGHMLQMYYNTLYGNPHSQGSCVCKQGVVHVLSQQWLLYHHDIGHVYTPAHEHLEHAFIVCVCVTEEMIIHMVSVVNTFPRIGLYIHIYMFSRYW